MLSLAGEDDLLLVAFSGHGMHAEGVSYLCPAEARPGDPAATMVSLDHVYDKLQENRAALKLLLADCCRNDPRPPGRKSGTPKGDASQLARRFERPPDGVVVLASCSEGQVSWEDETLKHGVFTHFLLNGLSGEADGNRNGKVSLGELFEYSTAETKLHVARRWSDYQTPQLFGRLGGVFEFERSGPPMLVAPFSEAEALAARRAWAKHLELNESVQTSADGEMVLIPPGEFLMGTPNSEPERDPDEMPHRVRVTRPFYFGKYEVTQQEYERVMGDNPSSFSLNGYRSQAAAEYETSRFPVEATTWYDAVAYCNKLSEADGLPEYYTLRAVTRDQGRIRKAEVTIVGGGGYRLPTEAEWEYACRAGTTTPFHFGASSNGGEANVNGEVPYPQVGTPKRPRLDRTSTVGSYRPNRFGLFDMHGNVWEWCQDWFDEGYYTNSPTDDPTGTSSEAAYGRRSLRGGSWYVGPTLARSGSRYWDGYFSTRGSFEVGFRIATTP